MHAHVHTMYALKNSPEIINLVNIDLCLIVTNVRKRVCVGPHLV